jgi:hypothetical protein
MWDFDIFYNGIYAYTIRRKFFIQGYLRAKYSVLNADKELHAKIGEISYSTKRKNTDRKNTK